VFVSPPVSCVSPISAQSRRHSRRPCSWFRSSLVLPFRLWNFRQIRGLCFVGFGADHCSESLDFDLIVLDPGSRFLGPEVELDAAAATAGIGALQRLSQCERRALVIACVHTTKGDRTAQSEDSTGVRGSSALTDGVRGVLKMDSPGRGVAVLKHVKGNNATKAGALDLSQTADGLWIASTAEATARAQLGSMLGAEIQRLDAWNAAEKIGKGAASEIGLAWPDVEKIKRLSAMVGDTATQTRVANLAGIPKPEKQPKGKTAAAPVVPAVDGNW